MKFTVYQMIRDHRKYLAEHKPEEFFEILDGGNVSPSMFLAHYGKVCEIEAADLDEVFEIGNIGPESKITRLDRMHSISVGDVIEDDKHRLYIVGSFGFERLGEKEAA